jgi:hypothetical protein
MPLLGLSASQQMHLIAVNDDNLQRVNKVSDLWPCAKFADVFDGKLGTFSGETHLRTDKSIHPVVSPTYRCPLAIRAKLKAELDRLQKLGVIAPVTEPTPWVSQIATTVKRNGELRVCICPKELNRALMREHFMLPILEDTLHELGQSRFFTKADLSAGYWHVVLSYEASLLTTMQTCFGRYRWLRLPFGTCVSAEIFGRKLLEQLDGLPGVICIADDVIIHGKTEAEHDAHLENFLRRCQERGIKLNKDKFELKLQEITFMGHRIGIKGLQPDPDKVKAVREMKPPSNIEELRRFIGMVTFLGKFLPHLSTVMEPLRNLTKKNVPWNFSTTQMTAFESVKRLVTQAPVLAFYSPEKDLVLENDASEYSLGSLLSQEGKPLSFASRTLSEVERRYAQIEKEMMALVYGLEKNHQFTYGRHVKAYTDHKPLVAILSKPLSRAPRRLQSFILRTQRYDFTLEFRPGNSIPVADALSRAPLEGPVDESAHSVSNVSLCPINNSRLAEIRNATDGDETLKALRAVITGGWPENKADLHPSVAIYYNYRDELSIQDGIVLRGERVVIPRSMRADMKRRIHAGHLGINSCLRRARDVVFWPGMSSEIRQFIENCTVCATYCDKQPAETLKFHETCHRPWEKVGTDLFTIHDRHYLVTVDYCSHFIELDYLPDTLSETVVTKLKHHFARHGIPDILVSDGGPQYTSSVFRNFSEKWQFQHVITSPGNSKSNGAAEAAVKVVKRMMRKCHANHEDPYLGLLSLRNTPVEGLGVSPSQRLFGRRTKTTMPTTYNNLCPAQVDSSVQQKQNLRRAAAAERADEGRRDLRPLRPGETVRLQPIGQHQREWKPATVCRQLTSRRYEVQTQDGRLLRRNRQLLRPSRATSITGISQSTPWFSADTIQPNEQSTSQSTHSPGNVTPNNSTLQPASQQQQPTNVPSDNAQHYVTRSGRVSKPPDRMDM